MSGDLFVSETGEGGETLVLLHGFGGTHRAWDGVREALGREYHVLAYDLPGHGGSLAAAGSGKAMAVSKAILSDLEQRGIDRFQLAGHSFGGAVATLMALAAPGRVAALTLFAPGGFGPEINSRLLARLASADTPQSIAASLEGLFGYLNPVPEDAQAQASAMQAVLGQREKLVEIAAMIACDGRQGVIPRESLNGLSMPVRIVWGELDAMLPVRQAQDLPVHFTRHIFPDLGHMLPEEAPDAMAEILRGQQD